MRVCVGDEYKPCYGFDLKTVVTIPFCVLVRVIIKHPPRFILLESTLFHFSRSWPFVVLHHACACTTTTTNGGGGGGVWL